MKSSLHKLLTLAAFLFPTISPTVALTTKGFDPHETVVYKTIGEGDKLTQLHINLFYPENHQKSDTRPAIVFFFGGGWNGGSPSQFHPQCAYLASRGIVSASVQYRVKSRNQTSPQECVKDGKSAIRWLKTNASDYGIDPSKIIAGGGSAGGHVAAATATLSSFDEKGENTAISCVPAALVLFNPVYDNSKKGYGYNLVKDYWEEFSPSHNITASTPPTITFFGDQDQCHTPKIAKAFHDKLDTHQIKNKFFLYPKQKHGFFNFGRGDFFKITLLEADQFLQELGYLKSESNQVLDKKIAQLLEKTPPENRNSKAPETPNSK